MLKNEMLFLFDDEHEQSYLLQTGIDYFIILRGEHLN